MKKRKKQLKKMKNKWTISLIGLLVLTLSGIAGGYFITNYPNATGLMYSLPLSGTIIGLVLIVLGIVLVLKKEAGKKK